MRPPQARVCTSTSSSETNVISVWMRWGERRTEVGNSEPPRSFWSFVSEGGSVFRETGVLEEDVASCATTCSDTSSATPSTTSCSMSPSAAPYSGASPPTSCFAASSAALCSAAPCAGWVLRVGTLLDGEILLCGSVRLRGGIRRHRLVRRCTVSLLCGRTLRLWALRNLRPTPLRG